ncbi:hypothetical protein [Neobacillus notoginsengisoli]|uniref:hypothetical protein n=1 Tax=Neobacillus notoginsengisoli TaxID=1578198 RepID=UPI00115C4CE2|nr:hypothetical protein [Neobacillus notoginsengisoli]
MHEVPGFRYDLTILMMYQHNSINEEIGLYELSRYVYARSRHRRLVENKEEYFESLYDDIAPTITHVDYATGLLYTSSSRAESTALRIIEEKERYLSLIEREDRKARMFEEEFSQLTAKEQLAIRFKYFKKHRNIRFFASERFNLIVKAAESKLCLAIQEEMIKRITESQRYKRYQLGLQLQEQ